ncbi:Protein CHLORORESPIRATORY REDUCTION 41, chloroplastic, partial [Linum grandiflorum]
TPDPQNQSSIKNNNKPLPPFAEPPPQQEEKPLTFSTTLNNTEYPIEKQRRSEIHREQKKKKSQRELLKPDTPPPNYKIGWKRTKEVMKHIEKPVGYTIMDFTEKLEIFITLRQFGSTELLAKVGEIVMERVWEEADLLKEEGKVEERMVTEFFRALRLMEMDLAMVKGAVREETLEERLEQAKARCRQAILVAASF